MKRHTLAIRLTVLIIALTAAVRGGAIPSARAHPAGATVTITPIGPAGGGYVPLASNGSRQVVGIVPGSATGSEPFYVSGGKTYRPVNPLDKQACWRITDINSSGEIAGWSLSGGTSACSGTAVAFYGWISGPTIKAFALAGPDKAQGSSCSAFSLNDAGEITGSCFNGNTFATVTWSPVKGNGYQPAQTLTWPSGVVGLSTPYLAARSHVRAIDSLGDVIGVGVDPATGVDVGVLFPAGWTTGIALNGPGSAGAKRSRWAQSLFSWGNTKSGTLVAVGTCGTGAKNWTEPCYWRAVHSGGKITVAAGKGLASTTSDEGHADDIDGKYILGHAGDAHGTPEEWASSSPSSTTPKWHEYALSKLDGHGWTIRPTDEGGTALNNRHDIDFVGRDNGLIRGGGCRTCAQLLPGER